MRNDVDRTGLGEHFTAHAEREGIDVFREVAEAVARFRDVVGSLEVADIAGNVPDVRKRLRTVDGEADEVGIHRGLGSGALAVGVGRADRQRCTEHGAVGELVVGAEGAGIDVGRVARTIHDLLAFEAAAVDVDPHIDALSALREDGRTSSNGVSHLVDSIHRHGLSTRRGTDGGNVVQSRAEGLEVPFTGSAVISAGGL